MGPSDYVLLELLARLNGVQGRKKLQKLAYVAKLAGAPLEDEFFFHYYGPYSSGLAARVDQLVERKLLAERTRPVAVAGGVEYSYDATDDARRLLTEVRPSVPAGFAAAMRRGIERAAAWDDRDVFQLELGSTLLYWLNKGYSWEEAEAVTERRKHADRSSEPFQQARNLAGELWNQLENPGE